MYITNKSACLRYTMELLATGNSHCCLHVLLWRYMSEEEL